MEEKFDIFDSLKKRDKPEIPDGFFDSFSSKLIEDITNRDTSAMGGLKKESTPNVPDGFFDSFSDNLMNKINSETPLPQKESRGSVIRLKIFGFVSAIAASLLIFFLLNPEDEVQNTVADNSSETMEGDEPTTDDYLAYVDESDIVDFLIENEDIDLEDDITDEDEDLFYYLEDDLEELYLDEL